MRTLIHLRAPFTTLFATERHESQKSLSVGKLFPTHAASMLERIPHAVCIIFFVELAQMLVRIMESIFPSIMECCSGVCVSYGSLE